MTPTPLARWIAAALATLLTATAVATAALALTWRYLT